MDHEHKNPRIASSGHSAQCARSSQLQSKVALVTGRGHLHQSRFPALVIKPLKPFYFPCPSMFTLFLLRSSTPPPITNIKYHQEKYDDHDYNSSYNIFKDTLLRSMDVESKDKYTK